MKKTLLFLLILILTLVPSLLVIPNATYAQDDDEEDNRCVLYVDGATVHVQPTYDSKRVSSPGTGDVLAIGKDGQWYMIVAYYSNVYIFGYMHEYGAYRTEGDCENFPPQPLIEDTIVVGRVSVLDCRSESNECTQYEFEREELDDILATQCVVLDGEEIGPGCGAVEEELPECTAEADSDDDQLLNIECGDVAYTAPAENVVVSSDFSIVLDYGSVVVMLTQHDINLACDFKCAVSDDDSGAIEVDGETYDLDLLQKVEMVDEELVFTYYEAE